MNESPKNPYEKPKLTIIRLTPEEVLVNRCKTVSGTYAVGNLNSCNHPQGCQDAYTS